jgi:predicted outer membrane repeat protein
MVGVGAWFRRCGVAVTAAVLLSGVVVGAPAADASTIVVTSTADGGPGSLRAAVAAANLSPGDDAIQLQAGATYDLTCAGGGQLVATEYLALAGSATIRQTCAGQRVIDQQSVEGLGLSGVTLTGGDAVGDGGAVRSAGFVGLDAAALVTANHASGNGGGIAAPAKSVSFMGTISNNSAGGDGGGIFANSFSVNGSLSGNTAAGNGGGGYAVGTDLRPADVAADVHGTVSNNHAGADGGGVWAAGGIVDINGSVSGNTAHGDGGGVHGDTVVEGDHVIIFGRVTGNTATTGSGGGIFGASEAVMGGEIDNNHAGTDGGGIYASAAMTTGSAFSGTVHDNTAAGHGGGIRSVAPLALGAIDITANHADVAGGGVSGQSGSITDANVDANTAGAGAGLELTGTVAVKWTDIRNNRATTTGGGVEGNGFTIESSSITGNRAAIGGGVHASSGSVVNSTIHGNIATASAGDVAAFPGGTLLLQFVTVTGGQAPAARSIGFDGGGSIQLRATVVAYGFGGPHCGSGGTISSADNNYVTDASCALTGANDVNNGGDPFLGPLVVQVGFGYPNFYTRMPLDGSPLINRVPVGAGCGDIRLPFGPGCDIGGWESLRAGISVSDGMAATGGATARAVARGPDSREIMVGSFSGTIDGYTPTADGSSSGGLDGYVSRENGCCGPSFTLGFGGAGDDIARSVAIDGANNIYVVGSFTAAPIAFVPVTGQSGGGFIGTMQGASDAFLAKYTPSGSVAWVRKIGGPGAEIATDVAVDAAGNVIVTGSFTSSVTIGTTTLTTAGATDVFVARYGTAGGAQWARRVGGTLDDTPGGVAIDPSGYAYVSGGFQGTATFDPAAVGAISSAGGSDMFLAKYGPAGGFQWSHRWGGLGTDLVTDILVDSFGRLDLAGTLTGSVTFDPGKVAASHGGTDAFVAQMTASGQTNWAKAIGGIGNDTGGGVAASANGNRVAATGSFVLAGSIGSFWQKATSAGSTDAFAAELDGAGNPRWLQRAGSSGADSSAGAMVDDTSGYWGCDPVVSFATTFAAAGSTGAGAQQFATGNGATIPFAALAHVCQ